MTWRGSWTFEDGKTGTGKTYVYIKTMFELK